MARVAVGGGVHGGVRQTGVDNLGDGACQQGGDNNLEKKNICKYIKHFLTSEPQFVGNVSRLTVKMTDLYTHVSEILICLKIMAKSK